MEQLAPLGPVYQAGTLSGNPVAMAAGLKTLELVSVPGFFTRLADQTEYLVQGLLGRAARAGIPLASNRVGGMFGLFFTSEPRVERFSQVMRTDQDRFRRFFHDMLKHGVYLAPSAFEAGFVSAAHSEQIIGQTFAAAEDVFSRI
jgi:glutamate-1-semialdehyde 2,1-aminomutase